MGHKKLMTHSLWFCPIHSASDIRKGKLSGAESKRSAGP